MNGTVTHVAEVTKHACKILEDRFPAAVNIGDVTTYDWGLLKDQIDVITAGFPCQDISNAGKREGIGGKRSGIWKQVAEAVGALRPRYVFLENVAVIRTRGLDVVAQDLAEVGYDLRWTTLRASDIGAAHHRSRWFGFATPAVPHAEGV
ncbi:DNA cytosine methyltransferase [Streptomyces sp. NPDC057217]|uniref:DNA cytosine methyltransferase n=1 Tax=Streptomyces sp. NPDC057217 TaxID=3346054 RepID=UPI0036427D96